MMMDRSAAAFFFNRALAPFSHTLSLLSFSPILRPTASSA
jgi:hypothetical protein